MIQYVAFVGSCLFLKMDADKSCPENAEQSTQLGLCPSNEKNASNYGDISRLLLSSLATSSKCCKVQAVVILRFYSAASDARGADCRDAG